MTRPEMESRRLKAIPLFGTDISHAEIGRRLSVSGTSVSRWFKAHESGLSLKLRKAPGRSRILPLETIAEHMRNPRYLIGKHTSSSISEDIRDSFGIFYDRNHVCRILHQIGMRKFRGRWIWE